MARFTRLLVGSLALVLWLGPAPAAAQRDLDPCAASRGDADGDGVADACECGDATGDGRVNSVDARLIQRCAVGQIRCPSLCDVTGDGVCNSLDARLVQRAAVGAISAEALRCAQRGVDADGDGRGDAFDLCPGSPRGGRMLRNGCTSFDVLARPELELVEPRSELSTLRGLLEAEEGADALRADVDLALLGLEDVAAPLAGVDPCTAQAPVARVQAALASAARALGTLETTRRRALARVPDSRLFPPDVGDDAADVLVLGPAARALTAARAAADELGAVVADLCNEVARGVPFDETLEIFELDPATGTIEFGDGRIGRLPIEAADPSSGLTLGVGMAVNVSGVELGGGDLFIQAISQAASLVAPYLLDKPDCIDLRIAPVQEATTVWTLHDPEGYRDGALHLLEQGMRLAAWTDGCPGEIPTGGPFGETVRNDYSLRLDIRYRRNGDLAEIDKVLAHELGNGSTPVLLPADINRNFEVELVVQRQRRTCIKDLTPLPPPPCSEFDPVGEPEIFTLWVQPRRSYCYVDYEDTFFDLEDDDSGFRATRALAPQLSFGGLATFVAQGYPVNGTSVASFPDTIVNTQRFAVFASDFGGSPAGHGMTHFAALRWPHARIVRNNRSAWYACEVPYITRDVVAFCPNDPDSFYRLPFAPGGVSVSQGECETYTHKGKQKYAWDFPAPSGTQIRAARGGTVVMVEEDRTENCHDKDPDDCSYWGNLVAIRHADDTTAWYLHLLHDGALVSEGTKVQRGDPIGLVGNTGNSTGPHLHFMVMWPDSSYTMPIRFEAIGILNSPPGPDCVVPPSDSVLGSTNE